MADVASAHVARADAALNVVNGDDVKAFVESFAARVRHAPAQKWFRSNLRNRLMQDARLFRPVWGDEIVALTGVCDETDLPGWLRAALGAERELHWFEPELCKDWADGAGLVQTLYLVVDWFEAMAEDDRRLRRPDKISVDEAVIAARAWHRQLAKRVSEDWPEDWEGVVAEMGFDDGVRMVRLCSAGALAREGRMMGHCVAAYSGKVEEGASEIYSLRDSLNRPHVTLEVVRGRVVQIRGRANSLLAAKWRGHTAKFVRAREWETSSWAGLPVYEGRVYADAADLFEDLMRAEPIAEAAYRPARIVSLIRLVQTMESDARTSAKQQRALIEALAGAVEAGGAFREVEGAPAADLPGAPIQEVRIEIAGGAFALAELGLMAAVIPNVAALCRRIGREVLARMRERPEALFRLRVASGSASRFAVRRFFASVGLGEEFLAVREAGLAHKRARIGKAVLALRHRLADRRRLAEISEAERARALNAIRVQAPYFCDQVLADPNVA